MTKAAEEMERRIAAAAKDMERAFTEAEKKREAWEDLCFRGNRVGISYPDLAVLSNKSRARIDQVIRKVKIRRGLSVNSQT